MKPKGWEVMKGYSPDWEHNPEQVAEMQRTARELAAEAEDLGIDWRRIAKGRPLKDLPEIIIKMRSVINWRRIDNISDILDKTAAEIAEKTKKLDW